MELGDWIEQQAHLSADLMERAISATALRRERAVFGWTVVPARGSVLASPAIADWNPEPDYFFHWVRDSAIVMRTVAELAMDARSDAERRRWTQHFYDFVEFSLALTQINGANYPSPRERTQPAFRKFLRPDEEMCTLSGDAVLAEPRFNPDGSPDVLRWSRPQYDGPALRALTCLQFLADGGAATEAMHELLHRDLDFTCRHAGEACIGPWEEAEENGQHYYVALVQLGALVHGRAFMKAPDIEAQLRASLDRHWSGEVYVDIWPFAAGRDEENVDTACLLGVLDANLPCAAHSIDDPRVWRTFAVLEKLFAREFPINQGRSAPALGRSRDDRYFSGGAWYVTTLAAASLCYRRGGHFRDAQLIEHADAFMATVRDFTPADGRLAEQIGRASGAPTSARDLTWSYAAFISAARLRRACLQQDQAGKNFVT